jgi:hypothetical protein
MSGPFDKHLKVLLFAREAEKCKTIEEMVEFCKNFLKDNEPKPDPLEWKSEPNESWIFSPANARFNTFNKDTIGAEVSTSSYEAMNLRADRPEYQELYLRRELNDMIVGYLLKSDFIKYSQREDPLNRSTILRAELGVWK